MEGHEEKDVLMEGNWGEVERGQKGFGEEVGI